VPSSRRRLVALPVVSLLLAATLATPLVAAPVDPARLGALHWRLVGPFRGGRALAAAGGTEPAALRELMQFILDVLLR